MRDCLKGLLPTLMHCAPRTQIPRISRFMKLLIVVKGFSKDIGIRSNGSGYLLEKVVIRSNGSLLLQTTFNGAVRDEPVKTNVSFNDVRNSSKRCLRSPHEFSRYIFCWIAFFAFITFDYHYKFYSRLSYNIQQFPERVMFWLSSANIKYFWYTWEYTLTVNKLCLFKIPSSSSTIYCHGTDLKNKLNDSLRLYGGLHML